MSALSIRKLPKEIDQALQREARARNTTRTEIVLEALKERFHLSDQERKGRRLRSFFGKMTRPQLEAFQKATEGFSKIDPDMWEGMKK
jgi:ribosomal protein L44E